MHISLQNFGFDNTLKCFMASGYYEFSSRMHQFLEIQYIMEGTLDITVEGKRKTLTSGDFAIIPPFCEHSFICSNDAKRWILIPSNSYISDFLSDEVLITGGEDFSFKASDGLAHYVKENLLDFGDVTVDLDKDKQLMLTVKSLAYPILNEYLKKIPQVIKNKKSNALASVIVYISKHYKENISRNTVASALGYNPSYISHTLEKLHGLNFNNLLNSLRISHAKLLIAQTDLSMLEIALECGFGGARTFFRNFKKETGMTPLQYKNARRFNLAAENK